MTANCPARSDQSTLISLSPSVRSRLRSGIAISSPAHCVEELMHNAIDAGARNITVRVDLACFNVIVSDDGKGITKDDMLKIGERYLTSKCRNLKDFQAGIYTLGYRGEALASLIDVSGQIKIVSKSEHDNTTWLASFSKGVRNLLVKYYKDLETTGTSVYVSNLMYNMPVRQHLISTSIDLEDIRYSVTALALANRRVSFILIDEASKEKVLTITENASLIHAFRTVYGKNWSSRNLCEVSSRNKTYSLSGIVASEGIANKRKQFVFVNNRLMRKTRLHKVVRTLLQQSIMCRSQSVKYFPKSSQESPNKCSRLYPVFCLHINCPLEDYDISFEPRKTNIQFENWEFVTDFLTVSLKEFLKDHNLLPPNAIVDESSKLSASIFNLSPNITGIRSLNDSTSSEIAVLDYGEQPFISNDEVHPIISNDKDENRDTVLGKNFQSRYFWDVDGARQSKLIQRDFDCKDTKNFDSGTAKKARLNLQKLSEKSELLCTPESEKPCKDDSIPDGWMKKSTQAGKVFFIHISSGTVVDCMTNCLKPIGKQSNSKPVVSKHRVKELNSSSILPVGKTPFLPCRNKLGRLYESNATRKPGSSFLEKSLNSDCSIAVESKWRPQEQVRISSLNEGTELETPLSIKKVLSSWNNPNYAFESEAVELKGNRKYRMSEEPFKFERAMFAGLFLLGQIDLKFIACRVLSRTGDHFLILFDQHAVHERIRLEKLINECFPCEREVITGPVHPPLQVSLLPEDANVLKQYDRKVKQFGISLAPAGEKGCFLISSVPQCFLWREASELKYHRPSPLLELVQGLLKDMAESLRITRGGLSVLPRAIGNVLNSQACRSAVKFGDFLSLDQCRILINQLEQCRAPFQCAHGRPSVAPILNISKLAKCLPEDVNPINLINLQAVVAGLE